MNIVTQIKKEVEKNSENRYLLSKQKKELRYYSLYLPKITKIQRWFRKQLVKKTKYLEEQIFIQLSLRQKLANSETKINHKLKHAKMNEAKSQNINFDEMLESSKENLDSNLRKILLNIVNTTDQYAKNSALGKVCYHELREMQKQEQKLQAEIQELQFQSQRRQKRNEDWQQKLAEVRDRIFKENSQKKSIQKALSKYS